MSLGDRWTTQIIVLNEPLVQCSPFRVTPHPNYALVVAEIFVAPMVLGSVWVVMVYSILIAAVLVVRKRAQNRALAYLRQRCTARIA